jgi:hypothetical protein
LGRSISGATVAVHRFSGLNKGDKIAESLSNRDGTFNLKFETDYEGPLLLTASGGLYRDLATGEITALKPGQELRSVITHIKMPEKTNINAWTTLAVARVLAKRGFWDKGTATLKDMDRINVDFFHMSYFLSGNTKNYVNIRQQEFFDLDKDSFKIDDPRVNLHLSHGGLSQLAKNFSTRLSLDGTVISVADLISALNHDLNDRIFDGRNANGEVIYIGNSRRINLNSYTLRKELSEAIFVYSRYLQKIGKITPVDIQQLKSKGQIIDIIAKDIRPELFPETEKPLSIDLETPQIQIRFAEQHRNKKPFSVLDGDVFLEVIAEDDDKSPEITLIAPANIANKGDVFGPITVEHRQNVINVVKECDKEDEFARELKDRSLKQEDVFCACFEASDEAGKSTRELSCFQRKAPRFLIQSPANEATFLARDLATGLRVQASINSGLAFSECFWVIHGRRLVEDENAQSPRGDGRITGNTCVIDQSINANQLPNGHYALALSAKDIGGRSLHAAYAVNFQVRRDMFRLPDRTIVPRL